MELDEYLRFVAGRLRDANQKNNLTEVIRLLRVCSETLTSKADELEKEEQC
jgi:hypothetical protein